jgi:deoxyadenosine/deoxycytidine kinase
MAEPVELYHVFLEGGIGVGKTECLAIIKDLCMEFGSADVNREAIHFIPEPVDLWQNYRGNSDVVKCCDSSTDDHNLLKKFYGNKSRYAYAFQTMVLLTQVAAHQGMNKLEKVPTLVFHERSHVSAVRVFAQLAKENGEMEPVEWALFDSLYTLFLETQSLPQPNLILLIRAEVDRTVERISLRGRPGEETINVGLVQTLQTLHDKVFSVINNVPVVIINNNSSVDNLRSKLQTCLIEILIKTSLLPVNP